jgi:hypothetical protein
MSPVIHKETRDDALIVKGKQKVNELKKEKEKQERLKLLSPWYRKGFPTTIILCIKQKEDKP